MDLLPLLLQSRITCHCLFNLRGRVRFWQIHGFRIHADQGNIGPADPRCRANARQNGKRPCSGAGFAPCLLRVFALTRIAGLRVHRQKAVVETIETQIDYINHKSRSDHNNDHVHDDPQRVHPREEGLRRFQVKRSRCGTCGAHPAAAQPVGDQHNKPDDRPDDISQQHQGRIRDQKDRFGFRTDRSETNAEKQRRKQVQGQKSRVQAPDLSVGDARPLGGGNIGSLQALLIVVSQKEKDQPGLHDKG